MKTSENSRENPLEYKELREEIHRIFFGFFYRELECYKGGEFDHEALEARTDDVLRIIRRQGGTI